MKVLIRKLRPEFIRHFLRIPKRDLLVKTLVIFAFPLAKSNVKLSYLTLYQIFSYTDDDNKENQANGKLDSPVKWSTQNGSDSGTYAEIGNGTTSTSERNVLDPNDSSEDEVPLPDAISPGRSSDGPEPRADITAQLDGGTCIKSSKNILLIILIAHLDKGDNVEFRGIQEISHLKSSLSSITWLSNHIFVHYSASRVIRQ